MRLDPIGPRSNSPGGYAKTDFVLIGIVACLLIFGTMSIFSVSQAIPGGFFKKHLSLLAVGVIPFLVFWKIDYLVWRRVATGLYITNILLLLSVMFLGSNIKGATRWIEIGSFQFQPSEVTKILAVITLSSFFINHRDQINRWQTFAKSFLHMLPILILVYKQPHLGATLLLVAVWAAISITAGVPWKYLLVAFGAVVAMATTLVMVPGLLDAYQRKRIEGLFTSDPQGRDYQVENAMKAIGAGGIYGSGYLKGELKQLRFVPDQQTDFIFSVVGEEGGLVVGLGMLAMFSALFMRIWNTLIRSTELYARMLSAGVLTVLAFHTIVNLGMNMHILPVVGLWLPFVSYGGTAMWLCLSCIGLVLAIYRDGKNVF